MAVVCKVATGRCRFLDLHELLMQLVLNVDVELNVCENGSNGYDYAF